MLFLSSSDECISAEGYDHIIYGEGKNLELILDSTFCLYPMLIPLGKVYNQWCAISPEIESITL